MSNLKIRSPLVPGDLEMGMPSPRMRFEEPGLQGGGGHRGG